MPEIKIGEIVKGRVVAVNPGKEDEVISLTLELSDNISGVIPVEEIGISMPEGPVSARQIARRYMGRILVGKVVQADPLVLSNVEAVAELKKTVSLQPGQVFEGVVTFINNRNAEIEYGNCIIATLPSTEYGWLYSNNLHTLLRLGQKLKVEVLDISENRVTVSHKQFAEDPRERILSKYKVKGQYLGRVTKFIKPGIFVQLEAGLDVLAAPYPWFELRVGDEVALELTDIDIKAGKFKGIITAQAQSA